MPDGQWRPRKQYRGVLRCLRAEAREIGFVAACAVRQHQQPARAHVRIQAEVGQLRIVVQTGIHAAASCAFATRPKPNESIDSTP